MPPPRPAKLHGATPVTEPLRQAGEAEARPHAPLHVPRDPFRYGHSGQTSRERGTRRSHLSQPNRARRCSRGRGRGKAAAGSKKNPQPPHVQPRLPATARPRPTAENAAPAEAGGPRLRARQKKERGTRCLASRPSSARPVPVNWVVREAGQSHARALPPNTGGFFRCPADRTRGRPTPPRTQGRDNPAGMRPVTSLP